MLKFFLCVFLLTVSCLKVSAQPRHQESLITSGGFRFSDNAEFSKSGDFVLYANNSCCYYQSVDNFILGLVRATRLSNVPIGSFVGLSPDGQYAISQKDTHVGIYGMYSSPTAGGPPVKLTNFNGYNVSFSPDSSRIALFYQGVLYSVPVTGGQLEELAAVATPGGRFYDVQFSLDSTTVYYRYDRNLYAVDSDGLEPPELINHQLSTEARVVSFQLSSDGGTLVYQTSLDGIDVRSALYSKTLPDQPPRRITEVSTNTPVHSGGAKADYQIDSRSDRVVYVSDWETEGDYHLYSAPVDGNGETVRLNRASPQGDEIIFKRFQISSSGLSVLYRASQDKEGVYELYHVNILGGEPKKINGPMVQGGDVTKEFGFSPDERYVVYMADQNVNQVKDLFMVAVAGGVPRKLNRPLAVGESVDHFVFYEGLGETNVIYTVANGPRFTGSVYPTPGYSDFVYAVSLENRRSYIIGTTEEGEYINEIKMTTNPDVLILHLSRRNETNHIFRNGLIDLRRIAGLIEAQESQDICFPIVTKSKATSIVCL